ncbi:MAG TPA: DUF58 domain-containing protein [Tepidisphaeraceae bacterium]|jgi:uncharacterized protein (DUF58 family)
MPDSKSHLNPDVLAKITPLGLRAERVVEGTISGLHRSPLHGVSVEFADYREYAPGDDLKRLDWRAYARSNRYFIKQYEEESNLRCTLLLDCSASMKYAGRTSAMSKFDYAATTAASLAHLLIRQRDAVGLALVDKAQRVWLRPAATHANLTKIIDTLSAARPDRETELATAMNGVAAQIAGRGLVIILSDLLTDLDAFYTALGRLRHSGHEILVFQCLDADEIELPFQDSVLFKDIEGQEELFAEPWAFRRQYREAMLAFIEDVRQRCHSGGIDHLLLTTDQPLDVALSHYLHRRQRTGGAAKGRGGVG